LITNLDRYFGSLQPIIVIDIHRRVEKQRTINFFFKHRQLIDWRGLVLIINLLWAIHQCLASFRAHIAGPKLQRAIEEQSEVADGSEICLWSAELAIADLRIVLVVLGLA